MSCNKVFTEFLNDMHVYLKSKFEDVPEHRIMEASAYIASRVGVLAYDLTNERDKEWNRSLQRRKPNREYPYVDEHEYNCANVLKVEEKPNDVPGETEN